MDPVLAQAVATLISAFATAILLAAAFYWGPNRRQGRRDKRDDDGDGT